MSPSILIVEDNTVLNEAYRLLFEHNSFKVAVAYNGQEALATLKNLNPHVILLDLLMPKMDGIEFLRHFKADPKTTKVLLLTNLGDDTEVKKALELGADAYALKADMSPSELLTFVNEFVETTKNNG